MRAAEEHSAKESPLPTTHLIIEMILVDRPCAMGVFLVALHLPSSWLSAGATAGAAAPAARGLHASRRGACRQRPQLHQLHAPDVREGPAHRGQSTPCALYPNLEAPNPTTVTLHPIPSTPHPTPYTLHPAPCTIHPTPYTHLHSFEMYGKGPPIEVIFHLPLPFVTCTCIAHCTGGCTPKGS